MNLPFKTEDVSERLLAWYTRHCRDLPWRQTRDPYRIWLSEVMLQQTTVAAVIPYYEKFLARFPDVVSLAAAELEAVLELWSGLGYYSRARNLHRAAQMVAGEYNGRFPNDVEGLMGLPGIGRSTAGAICSIAYDRPAPILDGNVRRVLARLMALREPARDRQAEKKLWRWAEALTPLDRPHDYAQAIMDLGATLCTPRQPECCRCPLAEICQARSQGLENELPKTGKKEKVGERLQVVLIVEKEGQLLLNRRPPSGLLGGMWEFPCADLEPGEEPAQRARALARNYSIETELHCIGRIRHVYSHFRLEAIVFRTGIAEQTGIAETGTFWHDAEKLAESPLHGAHQKALNLTMKERKP